MRPSLRSSGRCGNGPESSAERNGGVAGSAEHAPGQARAERVESHGPVVLPALRTLGRRLSDRSGQKVVGDASFEEHRVRRALFGTDVAAYDSGRPGYPDRVYEL